MTAPLTEREAPWAFWSPSSDESIAHALRVAGVGAGTRFLDLGCGDGRVLIEAAKLGAHVRGIDIDPALADVARRKLAAAGFEGQIEVQDMFTASLEADVIYAYLTPVTLSRLKAPLSRVAPGTRVIAPRYPFTGWEHDAFEDVCYLYTAPFRPEPAPTQMGWTARASIVILPADRRVLIPLLFQANGEPLHLEMDPQLGRAAEHAVGAYAPGRADSVPIDLIFHPRGAGSVIAGALCAQGSELTLAIVFTREGRGQWNFGPEEGPQFRARLQESIAAARAGR